ncbi:hypothetical protein AB6A40_006412 [Gnathostoma spinigerum]|uniref:L antigen family member 3 n=1 Tax=Gnathostoma spinigerum TaxID=75299 RepID=A0ABD6EIA9_9BILA
METSGKSKEVHQFCDESADEISDEDSEKKLREGPLHSATIRIKLNDMNSAEMIRRALAVDKEPKRSKAVRTLSVDGTTLIAEVVSTDRKYMQKSIDNFFDMCELAKETIDVVGRYRLSSNEREVEDDEVPTKRERRES